MSTCRLDKSGVNFTCPSEFLLLPNHLHWGSLSKTSKQNVPVHGHALITNGDIYSYI